VTGSKNQICGKRNAFTAIANRLTPTLPQRASSQCSKSDQRSSGFMDHVTKERRSRLMALVGSGNTPPEIAVRRIAHRLGFRFVLHDRRLPGKPDIVFPKYRTVIFVHGCFWHSHSCRWGKLPKSNLDFWQQKRDANKRRDRAVAAILRRRGWSVLTIWGCQVRDAEGIAAYIVASLSENKRGNLVNKLSRQRPPSKHDLRRRIART
jgi:DNA mismatch endonuclease (patch repair protein)